MASFSVLLFTSNPPGQSADPAGPYVKIDGREALLRTAELFLNRDNIQQIQVCFLPEALEEGKRKYGGHLSFSGVKVISGGPRWVDQIAAAADKLAPEATHILVHDAARPAVASDEIDQLIDAAAKNPAVALASPMRSAVLELDPGGAPLAIRPAAEFMNLLYPQVFSRELFLEVAQSRQEPHASRFAIVKGSPLNIRAGGGDSGLLRAALALVPKPKLKGPLNPFEEAQW